MQTAPGAADRKVSLCRCRAQRRRSRRSGEGPLQSVRRCLATMSRPTARGQRNRAGGDARRRPSHPAARASPRGLPSASDARPARSASRQSAPRGPPLPALWSPPGQVHIRLRLPREFAREDAGRSPCQAAVTAIAEKPCPARHCTTARLKHDDLSDCVPIMGQDTACRRHPEPRCLNTLKPNEPLQRCRKKQLGRSEPAGDLLHHLLRQQQVLHPPGTFLFCCSIGEPLHRVGCMTWGKAAGDAPQCIV